MKIYSEKELNKLLDPKAKIVLLGSVLFSASKDFVKKIASKIKINRDSDFGIVSKINNYVDYDIKEELLNKKIADIEAKQNDVSDTYYDIKDSLESSDDKSYYIKPLNDLYQRLENKRISYIENGLNMFSFPKLVFMQFKKNVSSKANNVVNGLNSKLSNFSTPTGEFSNEDIANDVKVTVDDFVNDNMQFTDDNNDNIYKQIIGFLKQSLDARTKLEEYRLNYPDIYQKAINDLTTVDNHVIKDDNDFIEEVGSRSSSR